VIPANQETRFAVKPQTERSPSFRTIPRRSHIFSIRSASLKARNQPRQIVLQIAQGFRQSDAMFFRQRLGFLHQTDERADVISSD
jgi:hypothetical protein